MIYAGQKKFDCGNQILNRYVHHRLRSQVTQNLCVAYLLLDRAKGNQFIGFYTLAQFTIHLGLLSSLELGSLPKTIPCTRLVMLGIDLAYQGQNLGKSLMADALRVSKDISHKVGSFGMYLDADVRAVSFYRKLGFTLLIGNQDPAPSPMFLPMTLIP